MSVCFPVVRSEMMIDQHLHGLDSVKRIVGGLDLEELGGMWEEELVDDLQLAFACADRGKRRHCAAR